MSRVLVTGASGFVGGVLCETLRASGYTVRAAVRTAEHAAPAGAEQVVIGDLSTTDWTAALRDVQLIVHAAARVHTPGTAAVAYEQTNAEGTRRLADAAARAGVQRLVYLSSVKVNGDGAERAYAATDEPKPGDAYARSKLRGEQYVLAAGAAGVSVGVVRPPLVYGPSVTANFLRLLSWADRGCPLPLASIDNRRSLVSVWNLCDLVRRLLDHGTARGRIWMVSDGEDLSTPQLIRELARALNRPARLFPMPPALLRWAGWLLRRDTELARLCGSLTVDMTPTCLELGWRPPISLEDGIARTARWYRSRGRALAA
jgi:nucleoside-diphosphate-sugar epimerase